MKTWTDTQLFFVVDSEFCQNEADDPKDAIIFFTPSDTSDSVRCTLCCHIMGICRFMKLGFAPVNLIRLSKGKFAIRIIGKYILALKGNPDMPDTILQRQLNFMIELFHFHYNSFETLQDDDTAENRPNYLAMMSSIWSLLLTVSQRHGDSLSLTLNTVPAIELPKTAGLLFLQALQFLQACQRFSGVYAGCLFCDQKVLCAQIPLCILQKLAFIWENQRRPGQPVPLAYELPGSVNLLYVYLTSSEVHELNLVLNANQSRLLCKSSEMTSDKEGNIESDQETELHSNGGNLEHSAQQQSEQQLPSTSSCTSTVSKAAHKRLDEGFLNEEAETEHESCDGQAASSSIVGGQLEFEDISNCSTSSYDSCTNSYSDRITTDKSNEQNSVRTSVLLSGTDSILDILENSCSSSEATLTQETLENSSSFASDSVGTKSSIFSGETSRLKESSKVDHTDLQQFVLYQQGYNDTVVVLLLDVASISNPSTVHGLWKLGMNTMMLLETDVRSCLEMSPSKMMDHNSECYMYLQYDRKWNRMQGNASIRKGSNGLGQQIFHRSVQIIHEDLLSNPRIYEMTICSQDLVIYGHKMGSRETYYHHANPAQSSASSERNVGFPLQSDEMCTIAMGAKQKLEKEHRIVLL